jgi:hypothetical protein
LQNDTKKAFITTIIAIVLSVIAFSNAIFAYVPSHSQSAKLPESIGSFTFEIIGESGDYYIVRVVEVHNAPEVNVGDIYHIGKPQIPESIRSGEI